jgi:lipopolysaccharide export system protein LptC
MKSPALLVSLLAIVLIATLSTTTSHSRPFSGIDSLQYWKDRAHAGEMLAKKNEIMAYANANQARQQAQDATRAIERAEHAEKNANDQVIELRKQLDECKNGKQ